MQVHTPSQDVVDRHSVIYRKETEVDEAEVEVEGKVDNISLADNSENSLNIMAIQRMIFP